LSTTASGILDRPIKSGDDSEGAAGMHQTPFAALSCNYAPSLLC
jgi:hypothetical protein